MLAAHIGAARYVVVVIYQLLHYRCFIFNLLSINDNLKEEDTSTPYLSIYLSVNMSCMSYHTIETPVAGQATKLPEWQWVTIHFMNVSITSLQLYSEMSWLESHCTIPLRDDYDNSMKLLLAEVIYSLQHCLIQHCDTWQHNTITITVHYSSRLL